MEDHLSDQARAAQQELRDAAANYQVVVEQVIENPRGEFVERLRHAEQRVSGAAAVWALAFAEGAHG
ncbi:MAG: hypothetical protein ACRD0Z_12035 [Acidimicrobiales bacterium]